MKTHDGSSRTCLDLTLRELLSTTDSVQRIIGKDFSVYLLRGPDGNCHQKAMDAVIKVRPDVITGDTIEVAKRLGPAYVFSYQEG